MLKKMCKNRTRGALFVEAAIVLPLFLYLFINVVYLALMMHDYLGLNNITRNAVRYASVQTTGTQLAGNIAVNEARVKNYIGQIADEQMLLYDYDSSKTTIATHDISSDDIKERYVLVTVVAKREDAIPIVASSVIPLEINSTLKMRCEDAVETASN